MSDQPIDYRSPAARPTTRHTRLGVLSLVLAPLPVLLAQVHRPVVVFLYQHMSLDIQTADWTSFAIVASIWGLAVCTALADLLRKNTRAMLPTIALMVCMAELVAGGILPRMHLRF